MFASKDTLLTRPSGGYTIARSVRFRSSASAYLQRTFSTPTSATTFTISCWVKRGKLGVSQTIIGDAGAGFDGLNFAASDQLVWYVNNAASITTTAVYRDPAAWYHIVLKASGASSVLYVNGQQVGSASTAAVYFNTAVAHIIGQNASTNYFDGYLTEVNFIDGQQLTPSSFGSTNAITGVWQPAKYTGTYGTNGFYLNFSDNSNNTATTIGKDYSGNGNNWTPNNISVTSGVTYDSMVDSPTVGATSSNYATLNPLAVGSSGTLSDGSLKIAGVDSANTGASYSTIGMTTGKWYFEVTAVGVGSNFSYALVEDVVDTSALNVSGAIFAGYRSTGDTYGTVIIATTTWNSAGVVIGVAVDCDNGAIYFANANTWINSGVPTSGASRTGAITTYTAGTKTLHGGVGCYQSSSQSAAINFGQRPFSYTPPTGFVALNTYNLPASTITNGAAYMAATTYTGTGASLTVANTVGSASFQPDFVWVKRRDGPQSHQLYDINRGVNQAVYSNLTSAEVTEANGLSAFTSSGFTVISDIGVNTSGGTYVGWNWKASNTTASNTNDSITSTVSAGATQGFSVVTYTGTGANATVGHGLGVAPSMVIVKRRDTTANWEVRHTSIAVASSIQLNLTNASASATTVWNSTAPSSTVFSIGTSATVNASSATYVAYCFSAVAGYSAFGSYTGNGSADGPFVYTGFRPRYVMIKISSGSTGSWWIWDSGRNTFNAANNIIAADSSGAEITPYNCDLLSNGFKLRDATSTLNGSGYTFIYAAFAENPFQNALAR